MKKLAHCIVHDIDYDIDEGCPGCEDVEDDDSGDVDMGSAEVVYPDKDYL